MRLLSIISISLALCVLLIGKASPTTGTAIKQSRLCEIQLTGTHGSNIRIIIDCVQYTKHIPYNNPLVWGALGSPGVLDRIISDFVVTIDGRELMVPLSSYSDLANVNRCYASGNKAELDLVLYGSSQYSEYSVHLFFDELGVVRRRVSDLTLGEAWEETIYEYNRN